MLEYSGSNKIAANFDKNQQFFNVAASSASFSLYPTYSRTIDVSKRHGNASSVRGKGIFPARCNDSSSSQTELISFP